MISRHRGSPFSEVGKLRVLHVVNDANTGGAQTLIEQLAQIQDDLVEVHILVLLGRGSLSERFESCAESVMHLDLDKRSLRLDRLVVGTRRAIERIKPDLVHSHLLQSDLAVSLALFGLQIGSVSTVHTTGMTANDPLKSRLLGRLMGLISNRLIDKSVACGSSTVGYMVKNGYDPSKMVVINNGVALSTMQPKVRGNSTVIVSLSRWHPMKDHRNLFDAFRIARTMNSSLHLVCAGYGMDSNNSDLMELIAERDLERSVSLLGSIQDVRPTLRSSDALIISSEYGEALPMAGLEALSESTPVITTDVGDCTKLTVLPWQCVSPRDSEALAGAIRTLSSLSAPEYELLSRASFKIAVNNYSIQTTASAYSDLYTHVLSKRRNTHDGN